MTGYINITSHSCSDNRDDLDRARRRAEAVKSKLIELGAAAEDIDVVEADTVYKERIRQKSRKNPTEQEWQWINEENRRVRISLVDTASGGNFFPQWEILKPKELRTDSSFTGDVEFRININSFAEEIDACRLTVRNPRTGRTVLDSLAVDSLAAHNGVISIRLDTLLWHANRENLGDISINAPLQCFIKLHEAPSAVDSAFNPRGRWFLARGNRFVLHDTTEILADQIYDVYRYDEDRDIYTKAYREKMAAILINKLDELAATDTTRIILAIEGHADEIGSEGRNDTLSLNRAMALKELIRKNHPDTSRLSYKIIDESIPIGKGEKEPLRLPLKYVGNDRNKALLGDQRKALGRNYNRRAEIKIIRRRPAAGEQ